MPSTLVTVLKIYLVPTYPLIVLTYLSLELILYLHDLLSPSCFHHPLFQMFPMELYYTHNATRLRAIAQTLSKDLETIKVCSKQAPSEGP